MTELRKGKEVVPSTGKSSNSSSSSSAAADFCVVVVVVASSAGLDEAAAVWLSFGGCEAMFCDVIENWASVLFFGLLRVGRIDLEEVVCESRGVVVVVECGKRRFYGSGVVLSASFLVAARYYAVVGRPAHPPAH